MDNSLNAEATNKLMKLMDIGMLDREDFIKQYLGNFADVSDTTMNTENTNQLPTQADLVMHKLMEECNYIRVGIFEVCDYCGETKGKERLPHIFQSGGQLSAQEMNDNFNALVESVKILTAEIKRLQDRLRQAEIELAMTKRRDQDYGPKVVPFMPTQPNKPWDNYKEVSPWKDVWDSYPKITYANSKESTSQSI